MKAGRWILAPNSGSRRKNNTPYLKLSPGPEDMLAGLAMAVGGFER
jgi:hypothetical protein